MISAASTDEAGIRTAVILLVLALVALGFWLRVRHLGDLGLVVDEGVEAQAVQGILKHGVPKFDSGLIYSRGLPFLYLQAATARVFGLNEFSLRLPAVLFGVASIWAAFLLAKTVFNRWVGLLAAAVMTFSVWEIEMSRYARFYTAFQFTYVIALLCFYRGFISGERAYKLWFVPATFIAFSLHDLGVMLATCFLILLPSTSYSARRKLIFGTFAAGLAGLWFLYYRQLRGILHPMIEPLPYADLEASAKSIPEKIEELLGTLNLQIPDMSLVIHLKQEDPLLFLTLLWVVVGATVYLVYRFLRKNDGWRALLALPIIWMAFICQVGLVLVMWAVYLAFFMRDRRSLLGAPLKVAYGTAAVCLIAWSIVAAVDPAGSAMGLMWAMFSYPNFYDYFLRWYLWGWPLLTIVFALGVLLLAARFISNRDIPAPLFMLGAIFIPAVAASFSQPNDDAVRYTIHLYPLMVIVFAAVVVEATSYFIRHIPAQGKLSQSVVAAAVGLAALFISQDANPVAAWSVGDWSYRTPRHHIRNIGGWDSYPRYHTDSKTPSLYVRERLVPGDRVIVLGGPVAVATYHYYIGRVDYALANRPAENAQWAAAGKLVDSYIGSEIIAIKFKMTDQSLEQMKSEGVPDDVLRKLESIKNQEFTGQPKFLNVLKTRIGSEEIFRHKSSIFRHAVLRTPDACCAVKRIVENGSEAGVWLLGDWKVLMSNDRDYADPTKEYLRSLIRHPDYWGLDGQTFAVKVRGPRV